MRSFWIKTINVILVVGILAAYQQVALHRQREVDACETSSQTVSGNYVDGTYEGTGTGFGGEICVQVVIQDGLIQSAKVMKAEKETPEYLASAEKLLDDVLAKQSSEVDTISGATLSSNGILEALRQALGEAGSTGEMEGER